MTEKELSEDEMGRIVLMSAIPMIAFGVSAFFLYLLPQRVDAAPPENVIKIISYFISFFLPGAFITFAVTFEILYHRKLRKTLRFHVKRFFCRVIVCAIFALLFTAIIDILYLFLFPLMSIKLIVASAFLLIVVMLGVAVWKFRDFFSKLDKGW
jgi:hypothetical protein